MKNDYSISEFFSTAYALILTRMFYKGARLIRRPFYCRGTSLLDFGQGLTIGHHCRFDLFGEKDDSSKKLTIGKNCKMGDNVHIVAHQTVRIGDNCLMASKIFISDTSHGQYSGAAGHSSPAVPPEMRPLYTRAVRIGNNVWIGENVCILSGVTIADGCIVGANAVVTKDIPENCIASGAPARATKRFDSDSQVWETV